MVTPQQIAEYIKKVPPLPETLRGTLEALEEGELALAARRAAADPAMVHYLQHVVNSAAYGFRNELKDVNRSFPPWASNGPNSSSTPIWSRCWPPTVGATSPSTRGDSGISRRD